MTTDWLVTTWSAVGYAAGCDAFDRFDQLFGFRFGQQRHRISSAERRRDNSVGRGVGGSSSSHRFQPRSQQRQKNAKHTGF
jgi:hypothetical protein